MNTPREGSVCGRIREVIRSTAGPVDTDCIASAMGMRRHDVSRFLTRMRRMGYVHQTAKAGVGRYAEPARWTMGGAGRATLPAPISSQCRE